MAIQVDIFDNELKPLLKLLAEPALNPDTRSLFNTEELDRLFTLREWIQELALQQLGADSLP